MTSDDRMPSDAQLTADQRARIDVQQAADREADRAEDARTEAQPVHDDPVA
jgi:hypothetical protein